MLSRTSHLLRRYFVVLIILAVMLGWSFPYSLSWVGWSIKSPYFGSINGVIVGLAIIMFGMGMTLSFSQIGEALQSPERIIIGTALQFLVMPLIAIMLVMVLDLSKVMALGVILLGCCPGGTASNVIAFLADADVPLSISVTLVGTLMSPFLTPWLFWLYGEKLLGVYLGGSIEIPVYLLMKSVFIIVVPVIAGLIVKSFGDFSKVESSIEDLFRLLSIIVIALIVAFVVSVAEISSTLTLLVSLFIVVVSHNVFGLLSGYWIAEYFGYPIESVRALSVEVGMQNSGLALALTEVLRTTMTTQSNLSSSQIALIGAPAILFSVWHNVTGPLLASLWSQKSDPSQSKNHRTKP